MRMRTIRLTPKFLADAIQGRTASIVSNLPADVELLDVKSDLSSNQVLVTLRSNSFEDITDSYPIPELKVTFVQRAQIVKPTQTTATTATAQVAMSEAKQAPSARVEAPTPATPGQSDMATRMAGEFSPDQRKLLSFKLEGDYVIVKPQQFLKEEWEDINEVVRSLGGKWVKGEIISFWQIPLTRN